MIFHTFRFFTQNARDSQCVSCQKSMVELTEQHGGHGEPVVLRQRQGLQHGQRLRRRLRRHVRQVVRILAARCAHAHERMPSPCCPPRALWPPSCAPGLRWSGRDFLQSAQRARSSRERQTAHLRAHALTDAGATQVRPMQFCAVGGGHDEGDVYDKTLHHVHGRRAYLTPCAPLCPAHRTHAWPDEMRLRRSFIRTGKAWFRFSNIWGFQSSAVSFCSATVLGFLLGVLLRLEVRSRNQIIPRPSRDPSTGEIPALHHNLRAPTLPRILVQI